MKVVSNGHKYELASFEPGEPQVLQFIEKVPVITGASELKTINNGTTNEEVLAMLIDRLQYLNAKFPCRENSVAITNLEQALMWLEKRTASRKARNVEGTASA